MLWDDGTVTKAPTVLQPESDIEKHHTSLVCVLHAAAKLTHKDHALHHCIIARWQPVMTQDTQQGGQDNTSAGMLN